jgi:hypothetical protein
MPWRSGEQTQGICVRGLATKKRRGPARDYEVGDRRAPKYGQFKAGVSGNPKGRPKGSVNFMTQLAAELKSTIKVQEAGKTKTISKQHALIKQFVGKALKGDDKRSAN